MWLTDWCVGECDPLSGGVWLTEPRGSDHFDDPASRINRVACCGVCCNVIMLQRGKSVGGPPAAIDVAFDAFYRVELHSLVALATSLTGDAGHGPELAQEALLRTYRSWETVSRLDRPGAWTRRVLINLTIDAHRRAQREERATRRAANARTTEQASSPVDPVSEQFWAAVRALPDRQRHAVALHYIDDLSVAEVARVLEVTEGTVKTSLHMARKSLALRLGVAEGGELR